MEEKGVGDDILILDNELIFDTEPGGESAMMFETDVLLLTNALAPEPVVKKIDVGPRISRFELRETRAERERANGTGWNIVTPSKTANEPVTEPPSHAILPVESANPPYPGARGHPAQPKSGDTGVVDLAQLLAEARAFATNYGAMRLRTRSALYTALGRTYDLSFYADSQPEAFSCLVGEAGLTVQDRAPYTPIIKLVFGPDYDRTRIAEFAAAISYGRRKNLAIGSFSGFLEAFDGGLKAVISLERMMRRGTDYLGASGTRNEPHPAIAGKLREISPQTWDALPSEGNEFALLMARRLPDGSVAMVGEVPLDVALLEKAARKLLANLGRPDEEQTA